MDCFYINLAKATDRRERLESNFAGVSHGAWALNRFEAVDVAQVKQLAVAGVLRDSEKACFLSHRGVVAKAASTRTTVFVAEDDVQFGHQTFAAIDDFLALSAQNQLSWDIVFTDICVPLAETMVQLIRLRQQLEPSKRKQMIDLNNIIFGGATAYLVNGASAQKVHALLEGCERLDVAYDIQLRRLIHEGKLKAYCLFPFLTTLSADAEASQIQASSTQMTDLIWNTFRRMVWQERQLDQVNGDIQKISQLCLDDESEKFGLILGALLSKAFVPK